MAMRCFGRAFDLTALLSVLAALGLTAGRPLAFDFTVLRADDLAAALWPAHFFFTAVFAAGLDAVFCLAIGSLPVCWSGEANTKMSFVGWVRRIRAVPTSNPPDLILRSRQRVRAKRGPMINSAASRRMNGTGRASWFSGDAQHRPETALAR